MPSSTITGAATCSKSLHYGWGFPFLRMSPRQRLEDRASGNAYATTRTRHTDCHHPDLDADHAPGAALCALRLPCQRLVPAGERAAVPGQAAPLLHISSRSAAGLAAGGDPQKRPPVCGPRRRSRRLAAARVERTLAAVPRLGRALAGRLALLLNHSQPAQAAGPGGQTGHRCAGNLAGAHPRGCAAVESRPRSPVRAQERRHLGRWRRPGGERRGGARPPLRPAHRSSHADGAGAPRLAPARQALYPAPLLDRAG